MYISFVLLGLILFIPTECEYKLLVFIGVLGCGCPISIIAILCGAALRALVYISHIYASAVNVITTLII